MAWSWRVPRPGAALSVENELVGRGVSTGGLLFGGGIEGRRVSGVGRLNQKMVKKIVAGN
jgi:hypothetical protein